MNEQISLESLLVAVQSAKGPAKTGKDQHRPTQTNAEQHAQGVGFDQFMNPPEPPCYTCRHALRRGPFCICMTDGRGYLKIGEPVNCNKYQEAEE